MRIWFTSDTHFGHKAVIKYSERPFKTVEEMDEELIKRWSSVVDSRDLVYHLGDFFLLNDRQRMRDILSRLPGQKILILGNHDSSALKVKKLFSSFSNYREIKVNINGSNKIIVLSHYAMRTWRSSHYNSWHLYGHSHGKLPDFGYSFDVGVDCHNFYPISLEQVTERMYNKPC